VTRLRYKGCRLLRFQASIFMRSLARACARVSVTAGVLIQQVYNGGRVAGIPCEVGIALEPLPSPPPPPYPLRPRPSLMFHKWSRNYSSRAYAEQGAIKSIKSRVAAIPVNLHRSSSIRSKLARHETLALAFVVGLNRQIIISPSRRYARAYVQITLAKVRCAAKGNFRQYRIRY